MGARYANGSLNSWLRYEHGIQWEQLTPAAMRAYRLRWLDALIEEFKAKGD